MITMNDLKKILELMGFKNNSNKSNLYIKKYKNFDYEMSVDFENAKLNYGDKVVVNEAQTTNFSDNENFVVFECIDRLIEKGYKPEDLELEKRWTLGHEQKSGRADICVYDSTVDKKKKEVLIIIECKTYGVEYNKELKNMITDGGQLFSYFQQEKSAKWLTIYSSDLLNNEIVIKTDTIKVLDDKNILETAKNDDTILLYKNASNKEDLFNVWDETYEKRFVGDVIFSEDNSAYNISITPLRKRDLKDFTENDNIVNRFEEILRHNNISDKENAFNRLIALFICKLVDEIDKDANDIVDFQYKVGTDTYETLQDRLQRLHKDGMERFMKEEITYIADDYAENLVKQYSGQRRKNMIADLNDTIRKLKFYTNNDFAFKDVHNKLLFYQNGKVLVEVVELFQDFRIVDPAQVNSKFLGDMFEQLLNKGFKQNEGQFFTPEPITRFIWESLPLEKIMMSNEKLYYPRVIDYACGAGHFIVQGVLCIREFLHNQEIKYKNEAIDKNFYGIEKDYRLARVSRVSLYMNDAGNGHIIYGDGLDNYKDKGIDNKKFDILVANPPYSVKEFKMHLKLKDNTLLLLDSQKNYITNQGSEIETCFVERISQLLKPNGIAAVILPCPLLSKDGQSFIKAREELIFNFKIRAIVELGNKTFGATGTNTIILFLEKYNEPPKRINLVRDSIEQIFAGNIDEDFEDKIILDEYLAIIKVDKKDYIKFINKKLTADCIAEIKYFNNVYKEFVNSAIYKNLIKQTSYNNLTDNKKDEMLLNYFYEYAINIEKEKMTYLAMTYNNETLIITAPTDNDKQEEFLGYKWSNRKGQEGIQILNEGGKLFNAKFDDKIYASDIIKAMFNNDNSVESELINENYHRMKTCEMLNFEKSNFDNAIDTLIKEEILYKYPTKLLNEILLDVDNSSNKIPDAEIKEQGKIPVVTQDSKVLISGYSNTLDYIKDKPVIVFGDHSCCFKYIDFDFVRGADGTQLLKTDEKIIKTKYLYYFLKTIRIKNHDKYERHFKYLKETKIPIPSIDIQNKIIEEFEKIDIELDKEQNRTEQYNKEIFNKLKVLSINKNNSKYKISDIFYLIMGKTPARNNNHYWVNGKYKWVSIADMGNYDRYTIDTKEKITDVAVKETGIKIIPKNTVIMSFKLTIGRTAITSEDIYTNEAIMGFINKSDIYVDNDYLRLWLNQHKWNNETLNAVKGITLNQTSIGETFIDIPNKNSQKEFVEYVKDIENKKKEAIEKIKKLKDEKQKLVKRYF